jgi:hypothetical protein
MPGVTVFSDLNHEFELEPSNLGIEGGRVTSHFKLIARRISNSWMWSYNTSMARGTLLSKAVRLRDRTHRNAVVDIVTPGIQGLTVDFEKGLILHLGL